MVLFLGPGPVWMLHYVQSDQSAAEGIKKKDA